MLDETECLDAPPPPAPKPKRAKTPAQAAVFERCQAVRNANIAKTREARAEKKVVDSRERLAARIKKLQAKLDSTPIEEPPPLETAASMPQITLDVDHLAGVIAERLKPPPPPVREPPPRAAVTQPKFSLRYV